MTPATDSFWDILSQDEADFVQAIVLELANLALGSTDRRGHRRRLPHDPSGFPDGPEWW
jgi:hypothetical protein